MKKKLISTFILFIIVLANIGNVFAEIQMGQTVEMQDAGFTHTTDPIKFHHVDTGVNVICRDHFVYYIDPDTRHTVSSILCGPF